MATTKRSSRKRSRRRSTASTNRDTDRTAEVNIERKTLRSLRPHPRNREVRNHPKKGSAEWEALKESLDHDYFDPLVWNSRNGMLVSGHLRKKVMTEMGFTHADVVVVDYDEPTHIARLLAANKPIGADIPEGLATMLPEITGAGLELSMAGFTQEQAQAFIDSSPEGGDLPPGEGRENEYEDEQLDRLAAQFGVEATEQDLLYETARGQTYRVGDHYLYVGSVLYDHEQWRPLLDMLGEEFPGRRTLLSVVPDPLMLSTRDETITVVFVQPSTQAADIALTFVKTLLPDHTVELVEWEEE